MLAKLSVLLGFFIAVSLGQAPDCEKIPRTDDVCCADLKKIAKDHNDGSCFIEYKTKVRQEDGRQSPCDQLTCIMKKKDYLLSDNKMDRAALTKFVNQYLTDYAPNIETLLEKCYNDSEISKCAPMAFLSCSMNVLTKECPSASWDKSEECTVLKNHFKNCPDTVMFPYKE